MLHWVGKQPLSRVPAFPTQHVEAFDPSGSIAECNRPGWEDWPERDPLGGFLFRVYNEEILAVDGWLEDWSRGATGSPRPPARPSPR